VVLWIVVGEASFVLGWVGPWIGDFYILRYTMCYGMLGTVLLLWLYIICVTSLFVFFVLSLLWVFLIVTILDFFLLYLVGWYGVFTVALS
jgi:hypothetical protein